MIGDGVVTIMVGDCLRRLQEIPDNSIHCCISSPPYWGLRSYQGEPGMIGLESTFEEHLENLVAVFREVRRVLRHDGCLFLNYGDAYASGTKGSGGDTDWQTGGRSAGGTGGSKARSFMSEPFKLNHGLKPKDLMMMPARVAMALRDDGAADVRAMRTIERIGYELADEYRAADEEIPGPVRRVLDRLAEEYAQAKGDSWWLRSEIIWHKCLSGGAWLYARTQKGVGPHMLKDLVRLEPATVKLWNGAKWTQVVGWAQSPDRADPREIVMRSGERIGCTADHRWPTTNRGLVETRDLVIGDILRSARLPDEGHKLKWLTPDALWFAGMYLAEGSMSGETIQLSGHVKETERWRRIQALCEHYGAMPSLYENGNKQAIHIDRCSALLAILRTVLAGRTSKDKRLSLQVWGWQNTALKHIVMGYLDGDGSYDAGRFRLGCTRNYSLERDLRCLAARLGATITLKPTVSTIGDKKYPSFRGEWRWERSGHWNEKDRAEVIEVRRSRARKFWDVSVADDPHLFTLASGVLTKNSNPMPESVTDRPTSAHEKLFLLSKSAKYFYDAEAVRVPYVREWDATTNDKSVHEKTAKYQAIGHCDSPASFRKDSRDYSGANLRNVWKIATKGFNGWTEKTDLVPLSASQVLELVSSGNATYGDIARIVSPNCPDHAGFPDQVPKGFCDGLEDDQLKRIQGSDSRLDQGLSRAGEDSKLIHDHYPSVQSTPDCSDQSGSPSAIARSTGSHRTDPGSESSPHAISCGGTTSGTGRIERSRSEPASTSHDIGESRSGGDISHSAPSMPSQETAGHSARKEESGDSLWACQCSYYQKVVTKSSHFATFPPKLVEPCIKAGTSEKGCCAECGAPWVREVEKTLSPHDGKTESAYLVGSNAHRVSLNRQSARERGAEYQQGITTISWSPTCKHDSDPVPCIILDPFAGAGTVGLVALQLGRSAKLIELSSEYVEMVRVRIKKSMGMFSKVKVV